jgi:pilus assembly protein CpaB
MNSRFTIMLIVALLFAGGAAFIAKRWVESQSAPQATAEQNTAPVVVAAAKIPFATRIEATHIKLVNWPKDSIPGEAFSETVPVIGKVTQRDFYPNEIILAPQVAEHLGGSTLSALIAEGMRAISVRVDDIAGVAGFILPGNKADIIASGGEGATRTLLKNMKILAIDQTTSTDKNEPAIVRALTLEVTPKQAEILVSAMRTGSLQFTLRNPMDTETGPYIETLKTQTVSEQQVRRPKAPITIRILPWTGQAFIECNEGGTC